MSTQKTNFNAHEEKAGASNIPANQNHLLTQIQILRVDYYNNNNNVCIAVFWG